jgi:exodeoxyribonuclease V gamma subunit
MIELKGIQVPEHLQSLYHIHSLQPFDPNGFESTTPLRFQDQWFNVAQHIRQAEMLAKREAWANTQYPVVQEELTVLDARQWIQDVTFPAQLYLKTLGVENLRRRYSRNERTLNSGWFGTLSDSRFLAETIDSFC